MKNKPAAFIKASDLTQHILKDIEAGSKIKDWSTKVGVLMKDILLRLKTTDANLFCYLNQRWHCRVLNRAMPRITNIGGAIFTIGLSLIFMLFGRGKLEMVATRGLFALAGSSLLGFVLKRMLMRQRPYLIFPNTYIGGTVFKDYAFPSGHTASVFTLAVNYAIPYPSLTLPLLFIALLVGVSRIYLGHHYPTDILAGSILGTAFAVAIQIH